jgi:hypothetical protein
MQNKTRVGLLMFLSGLIFALLSFYLDNIRGMETASLGLYQVMGAILGYLIAWIGIILFAKATQITKAIKNTLYYGGGIIFLISLFADYIGLGDAPGIDSFQLVGMILGIILAGVGFVIMPKMFSEE